MINYRLTHDATEDLIRIHRYGLVKFGEKRADEYFEKFFEQFKIIGERPYSFEVVDYIKPGYRRCVCGVDSIFYKINGDIIEIIAIVGRQDLKKIL